MSREDFIKEMMIKDILDKHRMWLNGEEGGKRADLHGIDLSNANLHSANLRFAILYNADLRFSDLSGVDLRYADLRHAKLCSASLHYADLRYARLYNSDLRFANLSDADLSNADLSGADLGYVDLSNADLRNANLDNADLNNANLHDVNLCYANLNNAYLNEKEEIRCGWLLKEDLIGFKKCRGDLIVELCIPKGSIVFSINNSKCRTNRAKVMSITDVEGKIKYKKAVSKEDCDFIYEVGKELEIEDFNLMYNAECSTGIHFFKSREKAVNYWG